MSAFNFELNLLQDNNGMPGEPIVDGIVQVGDTFFLEILMGDIPDNPADARGLIASAVDINFSPNIVQNIDGPFPPLNDEVDSIPLESKAITSQFPILRTVREINNTEGFIDDLGGGTLTGIGAPIGVNELAVFSQTYYTAVAAGEFDFEVTVDFSQTIFADSTNPSPADPNMMSIGVTAVPEPLTILGAATAAAIGTFFKRQLVKKG